MTVLEASDIIDVLRETASIEEHFELFRARTREFGHEIANVFPSIGLLGKPNRYRFFGVCSKCGEMIVITKNLQPKPWLFGRKNWKQWRFEGLPSHYYCQYLHKQRLLLEQLEQGEGK